MHDTSAVSLVRTQKRVRTRYFSSLLITLLFELVTLGVFQTSQEWAKGAKTKFNHFFLLGKYK